VYHSEHGNGFGKKTATAGTKIRRLVPAIKSYYTRVMKALVTAAGTAHTLTGLRMIGRTQATTAAAAAATSVTVAADPGPSGNALAANDLLALRELDGVQRLYVVSSVPSSYPGAVVLTAGLTAGMNPGASVWNFGVEADTDPRTGEAHQSWAIASGAQTSLTDTEGGLIASIGPDEPILLSDDNATAAGTIDQVCFSYTKG
jgi:hypothetical protein